MVCRRARSSAVCDYERMETECLAASGRRSILQRLKAMADDNLRGIALELTPAEFRGHFQRGLASAQRFCLGFDGAKALAERIPEDARREILEALHHGAAARRPRSQASPSELQERWAPGLAQRQSAKAPATAAQKKAYREQVLADRARGRKHAGRIPERAARGAEVSNSPPVPPAKRSAKAAGLERWALRNAWAQCRACGQMLPRDLTQKALARAQKVTAPSSQCPRCRSARAPSALSFKDVPAPLRGLSEAAARALSPLEIDVGFEQRAKLGMGYRVHTHMLRLRWKEQPVKKAIRELDDAGMRDKAKAARKYLRNAEDCAYQEFAREHKTFLAENPGGVQAFRFCKSFKVAASGLAVLSLRSSASKFGS
ncbi:unnamed protein product [Effrenium voratum]|nr:unnamed protein product [Effrenium voratum]